MVDLGSSNGTYVEGRRVTEAPISPATPIAVEFGPGGPRIRLFLGDDAAIAALPPPAIEKTSPKWAVPAIAGAVILVVFVILLMKC